VCAVADRRDKLFETFIKSNRLALVWAMPFGVGLALFAPDLVRYQLGERWEPATGLLIASGLVAAFGQLGFNYAIFMRAVNDTRPMLIAALVNLLSFAAIAAPLILTVGLMGWALGFAAMTAVQIVTRGYFLSRLFAGFRMRGHFARALAPSVPAVAIVLALRAVVAPPHTLPIALAELGLYAATTIAATFWFEGPLIRELLGYLRRLRPAAAV
jgi:O-antigen/teichoic acid export membrane protein